MVVVEGITSIPLLPTSRVAAKKHFPNFAKHEILPKLFLISRNFAKINA